jgi:putative transposase
MLSTLNLRLLSRIKVPLKVPVGMNTTWSMDFMHDVLDNSRKFRVLNIIDDYNREAIAVEAAHSFPAQRVVDLMDRLILFKGKPQTIRVDNGAEFTSKTFTQWCLDRHVEIQYIQPGKPVQNAFIERFNRTYREDILDAYIFDHINEVKQLSEEWRIDYNQNHPHKSLSGMSPIQYKQLQIDTS